MTTAAASTRAPVSFWQIWNMCFGFFGIQFGWGLQMANMSAIYEYLGAKPDQIPMLWLAAPLTGLVVQPIIGHLSDHNLGKARPPPSLLSHWRHSQFAGVARDAQRPKYPGRRRTAVDSRRLHQHKYGAVPRICRRLVA
jgi:MFS family permease